MLLYHLVSNLNFVLYSQGQKLNNNNLILSGMFTVL